MRPALLLLAAAPLVLALGCKDEPMPTSDAQVSDTLSRDLAISDGLPSRDGPHLPPLKHLWSAHLNADPDVIALGLALAQDHAVFITAPGITAKLDAQGQEIWQKPFGGDTVAVDAKDNIILTGTLWGTKDFGGGPMKASGFADLIVVKYDATGKHLWSRHLGGTSDKASAHGHALVVDSDQNILVSGNFDDTLTVGGSLITANPAYDGLVIKFDGNGKHLWHKTFGSPLDDAANAVAVGPGNKVIVTGQFGGTIDLGGGPLTSQGGSSFGTDSLVAQFDSQGRHLWSHSLGSADDNMGLDITTDQAGNVTLSGVFWGTIQIGDKTLTSSDPDFGDVFIAHYDTKGQLLWSRRVGGKDYNHFARISSDGSGPILLAGKFKGMMDFDGTHPITSVGQYTNMFLAEYGNDGTLLWRKAYAGTSHVGAWRAIRDGSSIVAIGSFKGTLNLGGSDLVATDEKTSIFIVKLQ
ncbi:MAG: PQQ-binding-like beta-propeller repeat protein [Deltaproteobacteria bacterium]|nr:PQQ-binding-like beta-propeller repeat protein [Deltaproteobacteria bacterium]